MDWGVTISMLIGAIVSGSGVSWIFIMRENKFKSKGDALTVGQDAMTKMLENIKQQQETFNGIIETKDKLIEQQRGLIEGYKTMLEEANQKMRALEYKVSENERKVAGMQKIIDNEVKLRRIAEDNICFVNDCDLRQPKLGTYKSENK